MVRINRRHVKAGMKTWRALLVLSPSLLWAQISLPNTPAAQRLSEWLKVFNEGDRSRIQQYLEKNFPERAPMIDQTMAMRQEVGGYDLEKIDATKEMEITCLVKTRIGGREVRISMRVEPEEP